MKKAIAFVLTFVASTVFADQFIRFGGGSGSASATAIGDVVTGGTSGSVLFLGPGGTLAQDNAKLFWDDSNFRLGIGNATPGKSLDITGTARVSAGLIVPLVYPVSDGVTAIQIDKADGTTNVVTFDTTNSRVGIGSTAPGKTLDVVGTAKISTSLVTPLIYPATDSTSAVQIDKANGSTNVVTFDTTNSRVGIGSTAPGYQLTVDGGAADYSTGQGAMLIHTASNTLGVQIRMQPDQGRNWLLTSGGPNDAVPSGFEIQDGSLGGSPVRLSIDTNGNVGIGTDTPASRLEVNGGIRIHTATVRPSCASGIRGTQWIVEGAGGVTDTLAVCLKSAADTYSWVSIVTGG